MEIIMSRSIKHEKTTGFLEHAAKIRRDRQVAREIKAEMLKQEFNLDLETEFQFV